MRKSLLFGVFASVLGGGTVVALAAPLSGAQVSAPATQIVDKGAGKVDSMRLSLEPAVAASAAEKKLLPRGVKSLLKVPRTLEHGDYVWDDAGVPAGKISAFVDMRRQMISVFRGGHEIGTAVVVYGGNGFDSPTGRFPILRMYRDYHSRSYDAPMPYSMFVTNDGVALHGSPMAADRATHGCIGLPISFARLLFEEAGKGDIVEIVRSNPA